MRMVMISWLGVVLLCCGAPHDAALASPAKSKTANARGMALMSKKQWPEAASAFKQAVAEDPGSVKAHYNLACAASRAQDLETAVWELAWVGDRATWDPQAKAAANKALDDGDLTWALKEWGEEAATWVGDGARTDTFDLEKGESAAYAGRALTDPDRAKIAAVLAAASGAHDAACDAADARQGTVLAVALHWQKLLDYKAVASLKDGVALLDPSGKLVARGEPLGCSGPGASQDQPVTIVYAFGVPTALGIATPHHADPVAALQLIAVSYTTGGRREWQTNLAVFARRDKAFAKVFEGLLASSDSTGSGHVWQTPRGNLVYASPGEAKKHMFSWDPSAFKFVAAP